MSAFLSRQVEEIRADPALRGYGAALALLQVLTAYWTLREGKLTLLVPGREAICWPLLPDCEWLRVLPLGALELAVAVWAVGGVAVAAAFLRRRFTLGAFVGLLLLTVFQVALLALDFRLRRNQHSMALWTTCAFLFVPGKRRALPLLICSFYFWAGTLKLNWEWLSGAALYRPLWLFTGRGVVLACGYVIVLELVVVWGLLARRALLFWGALAQLAVFHVFSWAIVGFFYPILMFGILAIFPLARLLAGPPAPSPRAAPALAVVFAAFQLAPRLSSGDPALTGEGRLFALHMFDARVTCQAWAELRRADGSRLPRNLRLHGEARTACDPIVIHGFARNLCRERDAGRLEFVDLDVHLLSRRASERELHTVIDLPEFCAHLPRYRLFGHNEWIRTE